MSHSSEFPQITGAVLAGGESKRLGRDKALLPWGDGVLLEHVVAILRPLFSHTFVVARERSRLTHLGFEIVTDRIPGAHALAGIHAALSAARTPLVFVCACDQPLLTAAAVRLICQHRGPDAAVVPRIGGRLEPLFALYPRSFADHAEQLARAGNFRLRDFVTGAPHLELNDGAFQAAGVSLDVFANVNTDDDLEAARRRSNAAREG